MIIKSHNTKYKFGITFISGIFYAILGIIILFQSCKEKRESQLNFDSTGSGIVEVKYARGFDIEDFGGFKTAKIYNPWQKSDGKQITYLFCHQDSVSHQYLAYDVRINVPAQRVICMSTTHIAMIGALDEIESIIGISGDQYINNQWIISGIKDGNIMDIGYEQGLNYEMILSLQPDVIIMYGITGEVTGVLNRLTSLGVPVLLNAEYLETAPLAKMEWIKLIGCLYDELELATKIFNEAEKKYNELKILTAEIEKKPEVLSGLPWKNTWWVPGGKSFAATFIKDAGGIYFWEDDTSHEAIPLDIEVVYERAGQADIWINSGSARSVNDILNTDQRLQYFKPCVERTIYNNNAKLNSSGGNDYWESGVISPHIILKDLISIFHPDLLPDHELVYYRKLE